MAEFSYAIRGAISVPDGSKLNDTGTGIILPDGKQIKLWEQVEISTLGEDDERNLDYDELEGLGIFYDGDMCEFEEREDSEQHGGMFWPRGGDQTNGAS